MRPTPSSKYHKLVGPQPGLCSHRDLGHLRSAFIGCCVKSLAYLIIIPLREVLWLACFADENAEVPGR